MDTSITKNINRHGKFKRKAAELLGINDLSNLTIDELKAIEAKATKLKNSIKKSERKEY